MPGAIILSDLRIYRPEISDTLGNGVVMGLFGYAERTYDGNIEK